MSRIESILTAIKNNTSYNEYPMSRIEEILLAKLNGTDYTKLPQSRIEELLIECLIIPMYTEIESAPPLMFTSNGNQLYNYRIYGNSGGVGDLDGETGKYIILITMYGQTENLVSEVITGKYYSNGNEVTNANMATSDFIEIEPDTKYTSAHFDNNGTYVGALVFSTWDSQKNFIKDTVNAATVTTESNAKYMTVRNFASNSTNNKGTNFCLVKGDVTPYYADSKYFLPKTYSISLDKALGEDEYIDFREQKCYRSDDTSEIVILPAIITAEGTTIISIDTTVRPEKVYLQGNIEEIPSASLQTLNLNPRSFRAVSLGNDLQLDVMPIEKSVLNFNDVGGAENEEDS